MPRKRNQKKKSGNHEDTTIEQATATDRAAQNNLSDCIEDEANALVARQNAEVAEEDLRTKIELLKAELVEAEANQTAAIGTFQKVMGNAPKSVVDSTVNSVCKRLANVLIFFMRFHSNRHQKMHTQMRATPPSEGYIFNILEAEKVVASARKAKEQAEEDLIVQTKQTAEAVGGWEKLGAGV